MLRQEIRHDSKREMRGIFENGGFAIAAVGAAQILCATPEA